MNNEDKRRQWAAQALLFRELVTRIIGDLAVDGPFADWEVYAHWSEFPIGRWMLMAISKDPFKHTPCAVFQEFWRPEQEQAVARLGVVRYQEFVKSTLLRAFQSLELRCQGK
jgi:hypothetical protein